MDSGFASAEKNASLLRFTVDSACNDELMDSGVAFAVKKAMCTGTATFWNQGYVLGFDLRSLKEAVTDFKDVTVNSWIFSIWER